jgi:hypothetical protein
MVDGSLKDGVGAKVSSLLLDEGVGTKVAWVVVVGKGMSRFMDVDTSSIAEVAMVTMKLVEDRIDV